MSIEFTCWYAPDSTGYNPPMRKFHTNDPKTAAATYAEWLWREADGRRWLVYRGGVDVLVSDGAKTWRAYVVVEHEPVFETDRCALVQEDEE